MNELDGKRVAMLAADGFEQSELIVPKRRLEEAGAKFGAGNTTIGAIRSQSTARDAVQVDEYDALVIPGGQINPDLLRADEDAVTFVKDFYDSGKPFAAVCHAPWVLVEAGVARNRKMTSYHSTKRPQQPGFL